MKIIINIHSLIDVITNSSSELFIINKDRGLKFVQEIINDALKLFPPNYEYPGEPFIEISNPEYYGEFMSIDKDEAITYLISRGYKVIPPEIEQEPEAIIIKWERGNMSREFISHIEQIFNTTCISS